MGMARIGWSSAVLLLIGLGGLQVAAAPRGADAKEIYEQATAAFGLGHYAEAAEKYEQAFSLRPDPALLYNAAQSYRLGGNKPRALELYRNCLRLDPNFANANEARSHIATLTKEIAEEPSAGTAPLGTTRTPAPTPPLPAPVQPSASSPPSLVGAPPEATVSTAVPAAEPATSIFKKNWFWGVVGAVVIGGTVGILLATRGTKYPEATFGTVNGN